MKAFLQKIKVILKDMYSNTDYMHLYDISFSSSYDFECFITCLKEKEEAEKNEKIFSSCFSNI